MEERHETEEEGWLLTYLDVITLMLVVMVVMLAFSGPPQSHLPSTESPDTVTAATTASPTSTPSSAANEASTSNPLNAATTAGTGTPSIVPPLPLPVPQSGPTAPAAPPPPSPLDQLGRDVEVLRSEQGVRLRINSELLFPSGTASLGESGRQALSQILPALKAEPLMRLTVEGHTDSTPIHTERFPSNWELSASRAAAVARYLIDQGIAPQHIEATGYADTRPIAAKENPVDRARNRRVELVLETPKPATPSR
ncbi:chemotaxis protein MotB [Hydrogenophaga electricum]|uniref:Chemotaxis protein MotB n=2 Tax=Comamonadaceae TaxID=80864 RepID=A0ABQ6BX23_9BURK|nr:chemotaxis protein MotB [Hydrogenophaga electricum]